MSENTPLSPGIPEVFQARNSRPDRLVHLIPDELAATVPSHVLFSYAKTANVHDGFHDVSAQDFARGVNRAAWLLREALGPPTEYPTVAYMGPNDIRYFLFMFGAIKVGYKMLFLSPRNSLEGHLNVLERVDCRVLFHASEVSIDFITAQRLMSTATVPPLHSLLFDPGPVAIYPYTKTFEEAHMDPALVLHTTGTTGLPKPVIWKAGILSTYEAWRTIPHVGGYVPTTEVYQHSRRAYTSMPLYHTSGLNAGITWSLLLGVTLVYGEPHVVPNAAYMDDMHVHAGVTASMGAPSLYEELSRDEQSLERINKLHYVVASGAPLSQQAGNIISRHTRVISNLGATETACLPRLAPPIADWDYFYWHPTHSGIEMRALDDGSGLFELIIVRDPALAWYQGVFNTFPELREWSMQDLYEKHPDQAKPFLYRYKGRKDDVIVLSNGEKLSPALMEATLISHRLVKGAVLVGRGRFQPAALIDLGKEAPPLGSEARMALLHDLLPVVKAANEHAPAHGRLELSHILFADPARPVHYLGQGKVQRRKTHALYEPDIEQLYLRIDKFDDPLYSDGIPVLDFSSVETVTAWLRAALTRVGWEGPIDDDVNLFESGLDSLQVIRLARALRQQARRQGGEGNATSKESFIGEKVIYTRPTLRQLAEFLTASRSNLNGVHSQAPDTYELARHLVAKYTLDLPQRQTSLAPVATRGKVIILTGSTGSLGSYILDTLANSYDVSRVICLNRSKDASERHSRGGTARGLAPIDSSRVDFLTADLSRPQFGLKNDDYALLLETVTHVIHNQWPVNFNWSLASFEPHVRGVRHLVDFSLQSANAAFVLFVSSVSAVGSWDRPGPVPEDVFSDPAVASRTGYGQSKLISEVILDTAARTSGLRTVCCRAGIVAGPVERQQGMWNIHEYIPSIFVSSLHLGVFPATFPSRNRVDWLPVDLLSKVLAEILQAESTRHALAVPATAGLAVYHAVNPQTSSWSSDVAVAAMEIYPSNRKPELVPFDLWVARLAETAGNDSAAVDVEANPAVRLVGFYADAATAGAKGPRALFSTRAESASRTLREARAVDRHWLQQWMRQWGLV